MLTGARHQARLNTKQCGALCGLSDSFLNKIERGGRVPELDRVPDIAAAYGIVPASELCWVWIVEHAPSTIPHLAVSINFDANPVLKRYLEQRYSEQQAAKEAARLTAETAMKPQADRAQAVIDAPMPIVAPFDGRVGYQQTGPRGPQHRTDEGGVRPEPPGHHLDDPNGGSH